MVKRPTKNIKLSILQTLKENRDCSYGQLERKINTNWKTIRNQCEELEMFNTIKISKDKKINITKNGIKILKEAKEKYAQK